MSSAVSPSRRGVPNLFVDCFVEKNSDDSEQSSASTNYYSKVSELNQITILKSFADKNFPNQKIVLVYQDDCSTESKDLAFNVGQDVACGVKSSSEARAVDEVRKVIRLYRDRGKPIQEVLIGAGQSESAVISSALSDEPGVEVVSSRSCGPFIQNGFRRFIIRDDSCELEVALGAMPLTLNKYLLKGADNWTR
jgi:hypothetical protein